MKKKCYFCHKKRHYIKDCFEKKKLEKLQEESNGKTTIASENEGNTEGTYVLIAAEKHPLVSGFQTLDVFFFHICPNREIFKTFESINGGKVFFKKQPCL